MAEIVLHQTQFGHNFQTLVRGGKRACFPDAGEQRQLVVDPVNSFLSTDSDQLRQLPDSLRKAYIGRFLVAAQGVVFSERCLLRIDLRRWIDLRKCQDASPVIIMTVAEYNGVNRLKIYAQLLRVPRKQTALPRVHQQFVVRCLNVEGQPVLKSAARSSLSIFHKIDDPQP